MNASAIVAELFASMKPEPSGGGSAYMVWEMDNVERSKRIMALLPIAQFEQTRRIADALERLVNLANAHENSVYGANVPDPYPQHYSPRNDDTTGETHGN